MQELNEIVSKLLKKENLTFDESYRLMNEIMSGQISEIKLASILTSLALKGESEDEIAGMAKSMQENSLRIKTDYDCLDIVGTGGDKQYTFNISTTSALVAASSGIKIAKHGNRAASGNSGSADVLEALNIDIDLDVEKSINMLNKFNFTFLFAQKFHPSMKYAMPTRKELAFKTIFNNLGPLTNPANSKYLVIGVSDINTGNKISNALRILNKTALVVHGKEGLDEASIFGDTYVWEIRPNPEISEDNHQFTNLAASTASLKEYIINPDQFGLKKTDIQNLQVKSPQESANKILDLFNNKNNELIGSVSLNAGLGIYISGNSEDIKSGIEVAQHNITNGNAAQLIENLSENN